MRVLAALALCASAAAAVACGSDNGGDPVDSGMMVADTGIHPDGGSGCLITPSFTSIYDNVLKVNTCAQGGCHGVAFQGDLAFNTGKAAALAAVLGDTFNTMGKVATPKLVVPGNPATSFLYIKLNDPNVPQGMMPLAAAKLPDCQLKAISDWITAGALDN